MIVVAIIGTLSAIAIPFFMGYLQKARNTRAIVDMKTIEKAVFMFQTETYVLPDSLADIGLDTLKDPWGRPYEYLKIEESTAPGVKGKSRKDHFMVPVNTDFDLYSRGPDGQSFPPFTASPSRDDIVRANNGQYMGIASEY